MLFRREKSDTSNQNLERCCFTCEKNDTSNQKPQRWASFAPKFPPFLGAYSLQRPRLASCFANIQKKRPDKVEFFSKKREKNRGNWIGIVLYISLSMKKIDESRQKQRRKGKKQNETKRKLVLELFIGAKLIKPYASASVYIQAGNFTQHRSFLFVHSEKS